ncbi:alpha-ketoglutarate-dependent dioxygenase alkB homolog 3 isoform X3 [Callorhinus ursinus]|uniref:Alpha-ketoglutarate-dependent dioxygenase alkB homolog 3 n=1 Tax=Callorhinus ursinus TaxID=34884 RepID=A0A3Q7PK85_CALUR|nr:alpha-ketoglutarate-dependent dioxygenase alkB homolog 3 isoform X3 [Callorhinus ursinus]
MEDKRRRARVQGAWAGPAKSQATAQPATTAKSHLHQKPGQTWMNKEHHLVDRQFVFKEPQQVVRRAPEPRVIDKEGVYEISVSPTGVSRVCLYPGFIDLKEADWVLQQLCEVVPWKQKTGIRDDVTYKQPRLTAWYGELPYTYSRITMEPNPHWHPVLRTLKDQIEENTGHTFNSLLCNLYRSEKDSVDWHSDDEPSLGRCPVIASLSFGATRSFEMRRKPPPTSQILCLEYERTPVLTVTSRGSRENGPCRPLGTGEILSRAAPALTSIPCAHELLATNDRVHS